MNVKLGTQLLSQSTVEIIRYAISDNGLVLSLRHKGMKNHAADFCEQWNEVIDICNGRHGPHSPDNTVMRQTHLMDTLVWFSRWKDLHNERVRAKLATKYNFFANETWFSIKSLLLAHITVI